MSNNPFFEALTNNADRISDISNSDVWEREPVTLDVFLKEHVKMTSLTDRQYQEIINFLGPDPKKVFPYMQAGEKMGSPYNLACWMWGKGAGKDACSAIIVTYCFYLMLCMKDPKSYFGFMSDAAIDIAIISYSREQALLITFDKIKQIFKGWRWLRENYSVFIDQKYMQGSKRGRPEVHINNEMIRGHNNVRILSEHSASNSYEGFNIVLWVLSEASAFQDGTKTRNGDRVFSTLLTSSSSRFPGRWKGLVMSYTYNDQDSDFTYLLYKSITEGDQHGVKNNSWYASKGAPWEIKPFTPGQPNRFYCGATFEFEDRLIPVELQKEFEDRPEDSKAKYLCEPPKIGNSLVSEDAILGAVHDRAPLLDFEVYIENNFVRLKVVGLEFKSRFVEDYVITLDLGQVQSATALALQHIEKDGTYFLDAMLVWTPDQTRGYQVDLRNVKDVIVEISKAIPRIKVGTDQWQSRLLRAELDQLRIPTFEYHTFPGDVKALRQGMSLGVAKILKYQPLLNQFRALRETKDPATNAIKITLNNKISVRKDLVDVVVGGFKYLFGQVKTGSLPGTFIKGNLGDLGGTMIG